MNRLDWEFLAGLCEARAGLRIDPDRAYLMENRLAPVARRDGFGSLDDFIRTMRDRGEERLVWAAVEAMAFSETSFFREPAVLERLALDVLPDLLRVRGGEPVRVWNAACGAGQEIYSLATRLAEQPALAARVELFASDISERNLEKAQAGRYSQFEVQRGLPAGLLVRHFEKQGEAFVLSPRVRQMVRWRRANLIDDLERLGPFDLIICRNVLPSLAPHAASQAMQGLRSVLAPDGRLALGLGEASPFGMQPLAPGIFAPAVPARTAA